MPARHQLIWREDRGSFFGTNFWTFGVNKSALVVGAGGIVGRATAPLLYHKETAAR